MEKEQLLNKIHKYHNRGFGYNYDLTVESPLEDLISEYEMCKCEINKVLTTKYKNIINNIPGFQMDDTINNLIDKYVNISLNDMDYKNLNLDEKRETSMLGFLLMSGIAHAYKK